MHGYRAALFLMALWAAFVPVADAAGKKEVPTSVSFHLETDANDNPKMVFPQLVNGETRYFRRLPEVSAVDVQSFSPFPTEGGTDYGVVFKLKEHAARRFSAITSANQGRWLIAIANGRVVDAVLIDKQIDDGTVVIWKEITLADIAVLDEFLPRIGQEGDAKKR